MISDDDPRMPRYLEYMATLGDRENSGERCLVEMGPYTAMCLVASLQLIAHHPDLPPAQQGTIRNMVSQFEPLFTGTTGEEIIQAGWEPEVAL